MRVGRYSETFSNNLLLWRGYRPQAATFGPLPVRLGYGSWHVKKPYRRIIHKSCPAYRGLIRMIVLRQGEFPEQRIFAARGLETSIWHSHHYRMEIFSILCISCIEPPEESESQPLAEWIFRQRGKDMKKLTAEQRRRLTDLGFCWTPRESNWEQRFGELQKFWQAHGHCNVPRRWMNDPHLRGSALRQRYRAQTFSAERVRKLDQLNFKWLGAKRGVTRSRISGRFIERSVHVGSVP